MLSLSTFISFLQMFPNHSGPNQDMSHSVQSPDITDTDRLHKSTFRARKKSARASTSKHSVVIFMTNGGAVALGYLTAYNNQF